MIGEAPHLLDPEVLDSTPMPDGKQRGMYYIPSSQGRSPASAAEFVDSIFEVAPFYHALKLQLMRPVLLYRCQDLAIPSLGCKLSVQLCRHRMGLSQHPPLRQADIYGISVC